MSVPDTRPLALADELAIIGLDVRGTVHLAKHVVRAIVAGGAGRSLEAKRHRSMAEPGSGDGE